ncbi:ABC transporter [Actinoplanes sp. ATCC 53533]|uniref:ATP-binding cassette domain-containing protein n=1 Tax=Actinoplanes sp. ATCC 53533 TaxID=1288362 RepID=UPI000F7A1C57|nr:ATP-binding cassette domain-containing protein [Actinoplanes sp. ATCC 53533]RSM64035.1 ABC transporter [Actinoplanes sp. ATCC 53533]
MTTLLHLDGVSRRFGGLTALHPVSIDVTAGTRHAVIGPNGAGKTTLLNLVAGTLRPTEGRICLAGRDITRLSAPARARHGIGRTWQHPAICGRLTVAANLALALTHRTDRAARAMLFSRRTLHTRVAELVDNAGLANRATTPAGQLPYGLQRHLELAMALATRPRLLLLDEPSAGLDPDEITRLTSLITALPDDVTVLLVDHNLDLIWNLSHTVTVLHHGQHLATGTPDQIRADSRVRAAYLSTTDRPAAARRGTAIGPVLLQARELRAGYHGAPVLDGVDLEVHQGEAVAVLGRNGAGKTTLLNTIAGLLPARGGRVELAGHPQIRRQPHHLARAGLAIVPQGRRLFPTLTVAEHLTCAPAPDRSASRATPGGVWTIERVLALLPALAARTSHQARRLSGGEQQMLALARALLTNPRLLVLDEPSEGLAPAVIDQLCAILADLTDGGLAVLVAEQNLALAAAVSDRIVVLHHGRVAMGCPTQELSQPGHRHRLHTLLGVAGPGADTQPRPATRREASETP